MSDLCIISTLGCVSLGKTKCMGGLRARRAEDKNAAWNDGESLPFDEQDLAEYEIDERYSVVRTVCVIRTRLPILMVPRVRGVEGAIGRARLRAFARTQDGDRFIEAFPKMLAASIGKIEGRREKHRARMAEQRRAHKTPGGRADTPAFRRARPVKQLKHKGSDV